MARRTSRRTAIASAAMAGVLGLGGAVFGIVVPSAAQAEALDLWRVEDAPDTVDRYTAVVDGRHLVGDEVVRPAGEAVAPAAAAPAPADAPVTGAAPFDPAAVLRGTAVVGQPAELERVEGVLQLRGPRGVYVLGRDETAAPEAAPSPPESAPGSNAASDRAYALPSASPDAVDPALLERLRRAPGIEDVQPVHGGRVLLTVRRGAPAPAELEGLSRIEPDAVGTVADLAGLPDDPDLPVAWALHNSGRVPGYALAATPGADLGALGAWSRTRGAGVTVAVLDSGYADHPDLRGTLWENDGEVCGGTDRDGNGFPGDCHGWNFATGSPDVTNARADAPEHNLHGTSVGSVIAATLGNGRSAGGIAPDVEIMPLAVGGGRTVYFTPVVEALYYAADNGADIINMSFIGAWGGTEAGRYFEAAMAYAAAKGVLLVAAAGNAGQDIDGTGWLPATSANPNLVTVGASTAEDTAASFSNRGRRTVDLYAPGLGVIAADTTGGTALTSGTSIASPLTAGVAALLKSVDPTLDGAALRRRLLQTVAVRSAFGSSVTGGRVDARAALATVPDPLRIDVEGLDGLRADAPAPLGVRLSGTGTGLPAGPLGLRVRVVTQEPDGLAYDVIGAPVDGGSAGGGATDEHGTVELAPAGLTADGVRSGTSVPLTTALPEGRYLALLTLTSDGRAVSRSFAAPFVVGSPQRVAAPSTPTAGSTAPAVPAPSTPAPSTPAPSTPAPTAGSTPTQAPAGAPAPVPSSGETSEPVASGPTPAAPPLPSESTAPTAPVPGATSDPQAPTAPLPATGPADEPGPTSGPELGPEVGPTVAPSSPSATTSPSSSAPSGPTSPPADAPVAPNGFGITHLSPGSGSTSGGQRMTLFGTDLPAGAAVVMGGVSAEVVADDAPTSVTVLTPARAAGTVDVTVYGPRSTDLSGTRPSVVLRDAYTYVASTAGSGPAPDPAPATSPSTALSPGPSTAAGPEDATQRPGDVTPPQAEASPSPSPSAGPADGPPAPSAPGTRGGLQLRLAPDVEPTLFGHAACGTSCTALRL